MINKSSCQLTFVVCHFIHSLFEKHQKTQRLPPFVCLSVDDVKIQHVLKVLLEDQ